MGSLWLWNAASAEPPLSPVSAAQISWTSHAAAVTQELSHSENVRGRWGEVPWGGLAPRYSEISRNSWSSTGVFCLGTVLAGGWCHTMIPLLRGCHISVTSTLPAVCRGCQMSGNTKWEEVTADVLIFVTNLGMCSVIFNTHMKCLPYWKELVHTPCKNMWLWQLCCEIVTFGMREPSCGSARCFCQFMWVFWMWGGIIFLVQCFSVAPQAECRGRCPGGCSAGVPFSEQRWLVPLQLWLLCGLSHVFFGLPPPWAWIVLLQTGVSSWTVVQAIIACSEGMADALVKYFGKTITGVYIAFVISLPVAVGQFCGRCDSSRILWLGQRPEAAFGLGTGLGSCGCVQDTLEPGQALSVRHWELNSGHVA